MPWIGTPSIRELILQDVVATLEGMTQANGFELDVADVTREVRDIEELIASELAPSETPLHQIVAGTEDPEPAGSEGLTRSIFEAVDWLVVASADVERAIRDVKVALRKDPRRGTHPDTGDALASDTQFGLIETAEGIFWPHELVRIGIEIEYRYRELSP